MAALLLAACAAPPSVEMTNKAWQALGSWAATTELALRACTDEDAPARYAMQVLDAALEELPRTGRDVHGAAAAAVAQQREQLIGMVAEAAAALEGNDRTLLTRQTSQLAAVSRAVRARLHERAADR